LHIAKDRSKKKHSFRPLRFSGCTAGGGSPPGAFGSSLLDIELRPKFDLTLRPCSSRFAFVPLPSSRSLCSPPSVAFVVDREQDPHQPTLGRPPAQTARTSPVARSPERQAPMGGTERVLLRGLSGKEEAVAERPRQLDAHLSDRLDGLGIGKGLDLLSIVRRIEADQEVDTTAGLGCIAKRMDRRGRGAALSGMCRDSLSPRGLTGSGGCGNLESPQPRRAGRFASRIAPPSERQRARWLEGTRIATRDHQGTKP